MKKQASVDRRDFFAVAGMTAGALLAGGGAKAASHAKGAGKDLKLGVASYSLRKFSLEEALAMTRQLGVGYISLKSFHLAMDSTKAERKAVARQVKEAGITLLSGGVIKLPNDEAVSRNAFEYARDAGMPVIVASPDLDAFPLIDQLVKEFDIKVAIHNHGPTDKKFPAPMDAYKAAAAYDKRIGCCIDIGHTVRIGVDEIECIHAVKDRLHDFHIKDVDKREASGKTVEVGRGVINIPGVLQALMDIKFRGHVGLEYEKNADNPMPGMFESIGYIKGALAALTMA